MISLYDSNIIQILPDGIAEKAEVQALAYAISNEIKILLDNCKSISVFAALDTLSEYAVDLLAWEIRTQYYDTALDIDAKRALVKGTFEWCLKEGTPSAVEELIAAVFGEGKVLEWFEYGDEPYFFKIITNTGMTPETDAEFVRMIEKVKNVRSHLRAVEIQRTIMHQTYCAGVCTASEYKPQAIIDGYKIEREVEGTLCAGIADETIIRPVAIIENGMSKIM